MIDWDLVAVMEPLTMAGALIGAFINKVLSSQNESDVNALIANAVIKKPNYNNTVLNDEFITHRLVSLSSRETVRARACVRESGGGRERDRALVSVFVWVGRPSPHLYP